MSICPCVDRGYAGFSFKYSEIAQNQHQSRGFNVAKHILIIVICYLCFVNNVWDG